ncbi:hypothetical protein EYF80_068120 [Liparis tanakae]|uniref:Uncharacterized protein n=1 Tax=Liparis tanakae TaxID=230148 RepID=A0A4Z2DZ85_9TELE|nr:hypothetical protein EYF80_068120 [Liparis tanakae]
MLCLKLTVHFKDIWRPDGRGGALPWQHSSSKPPQSRNPPVLDWEPDGAIGLMTSRLPWQVLHQRVHKAPGGSTQRGRGSDPRLLHTAHVSGGGASGGGRGPWLGAITETARVKALTAQGGWPEERPSMLFVFLVHTMNRVVRAGARPGVPQQVGRGAVGSVSTSVKQEAPRCTPRTLLWANGTTASSRGDT